MIRAIQLTAEQTKAIEVEDGAYVLAAPPGSGKTEVLVRRVIWLLEHSIDQGFRILALTFTTKAAESLRQRIAAEVKDQEWRVFAGTFHAFCLDVLRHYGESVGVGSDVTVYDSDEDRLDALRRALVEAGFLDESASADQLKNTLDLIDRKRLSLTPPDAAQGDDNSELRVPLDLAYESYEAILTRFGAIDFPGMLTRTFQLLTTDSWVVNHYRRLYKHVLVDEAQDMNFAQYEILRVLCSEGHGNVFLVADKNQSIYGFAGASPRFVDRFAADFEAKNLPLTTNFRSASAIVKVANALAEHFLGAAAAPAMPMTTGIQAPGSVEAKSFQTERAEAVGAVEWIRGLLIGGLSPAWLRDQEDSSVSPEDIAVLGRTRYAFRGIAAELEANSVPFVMRTGEAGLFDSIWGRGLYYALRLISNPKDWPSARRIRGLAGLTDTEPEALRGGELELSDLLITVPHLLGMPKEAATILKNLAEQHIDVAEALNTFLEMAAPHDGSEQIEAAILWAADQEHLIGSWQQYAVRTQPNERSLSDFLAFLAQAQRITLNEPGVRVLTVHAAKGLEFRAVVVVGMNDGMFPYYLSLNSEEELDEERRNAYVAITRASRALRLTRPASRHTRYGIRQDPPSRFLAEMGMPLLEGKQDHEEVPF
jgi:DNA helicase-2/ATP-dependent DNA helicase PcrA